MGLKGSRMPESEDASGFASVLMALMLLSVAFCGAPANRAADIGYSNPPWTIEVVDDSGDAGSVKTSIALEPAGIVHVCYYDAYNRLLKHAERDLAGDWAVETVDESVGVGNESSMALDATGGLHVAYFDQSNDDLMYAHHPKGGDWTVRTIDFEGNVGEWPSIAVDPTGSAHIVYFDDTKAGIKHAVSRDYRTWSIEEIDCFDIFSHGRTSLAIDAEGRLHMAFVAESVTSAAGPSVFYDNTSSDGCWRPAPKLHGFTCSECVSIGVDPMGNVALAAEGRAPSVYCAIIAPNGTERFINPFKMAETVIQPSLAVDNEGRLHVSAYTRTMYGLVYAFDSWRWEYADLEFDGGKYSSIAVDANDHVHIAYYDINKKALRYATNKDVPSPPSGLTATFGDGRVALAWRHPLDNGSSGLSGYCVYRQAPGLKGPVKLATVGPFATYLDTSVTNKAAYTYWVTARNRDWEGGPSLCATATPRLLPSMPLDVRATAGDRTVNLTWHPPAEVGLHPVIWYRINWTESPGHYAHQVHGGWAGDSRSDLPVTRCGNITVGAGVLSFMHTNLTNGMRYAYKLTAVHAFGEGEESPLFWASPIGLPSGPRDLRATITKWGVNLTWSPPINNGTTDLIWYRVYRGTSHDDLAFLVNVTPIHMGFDWGYFLPAPTCFLDDDYADGVVFYYKVTAANGRGEGPPSVTVRVPYSPLPGPPRGLEVTTTEKGLELTWNAPEDPGEQPVLLYRVYRRTLIGQPRLMGTVDSNATRFMDASANRSVWYNYSVTAVSGAGEGEPCGEVDGMLPEGRHHAPAVAPLSKVIADHREVLVAALATACVAGALLAILRKRRSTGSA